VEGNERLTDALALVLLILLGVEAATTLDLSAYLAVRIFLGLLLLPAVSLKLASTGWRAARYYAGPSEHRSKGPPRILLRLLAVPLVASTLVLFGTGVAFLVTGRGSGILLDLHAGSFAVWGERSGFLLAPMRTVPAHVTLPNVAVRCVIVDDNPAFLEAATALLEREGLNVVGTTSTSDGALGQVRELLPDVVLVDIMLGGESGFDLARRLAEADLGSTVILISTHSESDFADLISETPAAGFVPKSELSASAIRQLVDAQDQG
jgi:CheY-like chemotaxis protein